MIIIEAIAEGITVNFTAGVVNPDRVAVRFVSPCACPVAMPFEDIVAILVSELAQVMLEEISAVEPLSKVPTIVNCWMPPAVKFAGAFGFITMEDSAGAGIIVKAMAVLVIPDRAAVMLTFPVLIPVAKPVEESVATVLSEIVQLALELTSAFDLSE